MQDLVKIASNFLATMDLSISKGCYNLADDAVLDWFGHIVCGRERIKMFMLKHFEKTNHSVRKVTPVAEVNHWKLTPNAQPLNNDDNKMEAECGQGDVASKVAVTPDQPIKIDYQEMVKAPVVKVGRAVALPISRRLRFVEMRAKVRVEKTGFSGSTDTWPLAVKNLVLGVDDGGDVAFVMYENGPVQPLPFQRRLVFN